MVKLPLRITRKTLILLLVVLVAELLVVTVFYAQQRSAVSQLDAERKKVDSQLQAAQTLSSQLQSSQQKVEGARGDLKQLEGKLPDKEYVPTLLTQLQALAISTHNTITTVQPNLTPPPPPPANNVPTGNPTNSSGGANNNNGSGANGNGAAGGSGDNAAPAGPPYDEYRVDLSVQGQYHDVMTFLMKLTQFPKIVSVDQCQLTSQPPAVPGAPGLVTANLKFTAYILKGS